MSDIKTDIEGLARELANALTDYNQDVADAVKVAVDEQAEETVKDIQAAAPKDTGAYQKGWRKKKAYEANYDKRNTVYNKDHYQLTHLLEKGHVRKNTDRGRKTHVSRKGFTAARVHIAPAEERMKTGLEEKITKAVGKI